MDGGYQSDTNIYGGSLLSIGGNYTGSDFGPGLGLSNSTLRVRGNFQNGAYEGNNFFLGGSTAVIGGEFSSTDGASVFLSASSLTVGGGFEATQDGTAIIRNGSAVIVGGSIGIRGGEFDLDKSSSVTAQGAFVVNSSIFTGGTISPIHVFNRSVAHADDRLADVLNKTPSREASPPSAA